MRYQDRQNKKLQEKIVSEATVAISGQQNIIAVDTSGQYECSLEPAILEAIQFVTSVLMKKMMQHVLHRMKTRIKMKENSPISLPRFNCPIFKNSFILIASLYQADSFATSPPLCSKRWCDPVSQM